MISARLKAAMADLADDQNFIEGHELDPKTASKVPQEAIGRRLSQDEAAELLDHLAACLLVHVLFFSPPCHPRTNMAAGSRTCASASSCSATRATWRKS